MDGEYIPQWSDDYLIGHKSIDTEHHFLFSMLHYLNNVLGLGDENREVILSTLQQFIYYSRIHFRCEEEMMRLCHYGGYEHHRQEHEDFILLAVKFLERAHTSESLQALEIGKFLNEWLLSHFLEEDVKLINLVL